MESSDSESPDPGNRFKCTIKGCTASFPKNRKLINHIRKHTGERPFVCDEPGCDKSYTNSSHLKRHKTVSHGEKKSQTVVCDFEGCGTVLANKYSLKKHISRMHNPEIYPFKCNECSQGFHRKRQLQEHSYLHTGEPAYSCDKCERKFTTNYQLNKHKRWHRTYDCKCGETFNRWSLILAHKKLCPETAAKCNICDKTFKEKRNLKNHIESVHLDKKLVFKCSYPDCKRFYYYKKNLKYHILNFHEKINQNQRYKCTYPKCLVILKTKKSLKMHLQKHFKWVKKKQRQPRCDKGKPKKSMISILIGEDPSKKDETEKNEDLTNINLFEPQVQIDEEITDDVLLRECEVTLNLLNEEMITVS